MAGIRHPALLRYSVIHIICRSHWWARSAKLSGWDFVTFGFCYILRTRPSEVQCFAKYSGVILKKVPNTVFAKNSSTETSVLNLGFNTYHLIWFTFHCRAEVTSPGGSTAEGIRALERGRLRSVVLIITIENIHLVQDLLFQVHHHGCRGYHGGQVPSFQVTGYGDVVYNNYDNASNL